MTANRQRALFLDRDGTLIRDTGYPRAPELVELLPGVAAALREAREALYALVIISNQSGVGRGLILPTEARAVQDRVEQLFRLEGVTFDGAWFCFHAPEDGCLCRKPAPGMIVDAARVLDLDLGRSFMIGDKRSDIEAGLAAGCSSVSFGDDPHPDAAFAFTSWPDLAAWLRVKG